MNSSTPDVRNLTQKALSAAVKAHENANGTASQFTLPGSDIHVTISACYIGGSGQHRAWKYLYYLTINGRKFGGYDQRDSFVSWAVKKINEVASPDSAQTYSAGDPGVSAQASVGAPEFERGIVMVETREAHNLEVAGSNPAPATNSLPNGLIVDEKLAVAMDEGQNSSNAWRIHEHMQHGLDRLARSVEGILLRAKVVEPEMAEVGQ